MTSKILTSLFAGLLLPWSYFLFVQVGPVRTHTPGGVETIGPSGIAGFIQFHGWQDALLTYGKAFAVCALLTLIVCELNDVIAAIIRRKSGKK